MVGIRHSAGGRGGGAGEEEGMNFEVVGGKLPERRLVVGGGFGDEAEANVF